MRGRKNNILNSSKRVVSSSTLRELGTSGDISPNQLNHIFKKGPLSWNKFIDRRRFVEPNYQPNLADLLFEDKEYEGYDFSGMSFENTSIGGKKFTKCNFDGADFKNASAFMMHIDFSSVCDVNFANADLTCSAFFGGILKNVKFGKALMHGVDFEHQDEMEGCDFSNSVLTECQFKRTTLTRCNFENSKLRYCWFENLEFDDVNIKSIELESTDGGENKWITSPKVDTARIITGHNPFLAKKPDDIDSLL